MLWTCKTWCSMFLMHTSRKRTLQNASVIHIINVFTIDLCTYENISLLRKREEDCPFSFSVFYRPIIDPFSRCWIDKRGGVSSYKTNRLFVWMSMTKVLIEDTFLYVSYTNRDGTAIHVACFRRCGSTGTAQREVCKNNNRGSRYTPLSERLAWNRLHFHWATILDKINGKFDPSPNSLWNQGWENGVFWLLRGVILYLGRWGFAVPFYFVQDCRPASVKRI